MADTPWKPWTASPDVFLKSVERVYDKGATIYVIRPNGKVEVIPPEDFYLPEAKPMMDKPDYDKAFSYLDSAGYKGMK